MCQFRFLNFHLNFENFLWSMLYRVFFGNNPNRPTRNQEKGRIRGKYAFDSSPSQTSHLEICSKQISKFVQHQIVLRNFLFSNFYFLFESFSFSNMGRQAWIAVCTSFTISAAASLDAI